MLVASPFTFASQVSDLARFIATHRRGNGMAPLPEPRDPHKHKSPKRDAFLAFFDPSCRYSVDELRDMTGFESRKVHTLLYQAMNAGLVSDAGSGRSRVYFLTPSTQDEQESL